MRLLALPLALLLLATTACTRNAPPENTPPGHDTPTQHDAPPDAEPALTGRVLLPPGEGRRGVELWITYTTADGQTHDRWVRFDAAGHFAHPLAPGNPSTPGDQPTAVSVSAAGIEVYHADADALPAPDAQGRIALGTLDLRDRLVPHTITFRPAHGSPAGDIRVAFWPGPPPTGPRGGAVSLGSAQFPTQPLNTPTHWLLPPDAKTLYLLVERPANPLPGQPWRTGYQQQFGPYPTQQLPQELHVAGQ